MTYVCKDRRTDKVALTTQHPRQRTSRECLIRDRDWQRRGGSYGVYVCCGVCGVRCVVCGVR
jgi:hypothetical protein